MHRLVPLLVALLALLAACAGATSNVQLAIPSPAASIPAPTPSAAVDASVVATGELAPATATPYSAASWPAGTPRIPTHAPGELVPDTPTPAAPAALPTTEQGTIALPAVATPDIQPLHALTRTATYTDSVIGYALDYPAGWQINAQPGWLVSLTSFTVGDSGIGGIQPGNVKIDLAPDKPGEARTLEQLVAETKGSAEGIPVTVLREERWELLGGIPAVRIDRQSEPAGETAVLLAVINGRSLRLVGYGDLRWFDAVARTLRPISPTGQTQSGAPTAALDETTAPLARATEAPCPPACTPAPVPPEQPPQDRAAPADSRITSHPGVKALLAALDQRGLGFRLEGPSRAAFLAPVPGAAYAGPTGRLFLHVFPDADAASRRADEIPAELDPQRSLIDWVGEPHFYRCQEVIALYLGRDEQTQSALAEYCGPEFATSK